MDAASATIADGLTVALWPRYALMWAVAIALYFASKVVSCLGGAAPGAPMGRRIGYLLAWPGMNPAEFFDLAARPARPPAREWLTAAANVALGIWLIGISAELPGAAEKGWIGIVGVVLVLHFGLFHLLSCGWRLAGVDARPIMDRPIAATSLSDFWNRRWNRAFHDLAQRFVFRPLAPRVGPAAALWIGFLVSGLVHELVISLPAGGGYGLPTIYFLLQAAGLLAQRSGVLRPIGLGQRTPGRLFTAAVVLLPLPLLFHAAFITRIAAPFIDFVGGVLCLPRY